MVVINHTFVEQTTEQTNQGNTNYTDISGAEITSGNFTAGNKYLIMVNAQFGGSFTMEAFGIKTLHGSTDFAESEHVMEPEHNGAKEYMRSYTWFTVWTAVASEEIKLQFKTFGNPRTVKADQITLTAIELEEFTENTDYFFDFSTTDTALTSSFSTSNNASVSFTPSVASDWLVLAYDTIEPGNTDQYESRIETTGGLSLTEPTTSVEGEADSGSGEVDIFNDFLSRIYSLTAVSHTFTQQARNIDGSDGDRTNSAIFAINLNKFKNHSFAFTEGTVAGTGGTSEVQTTSITPLTTSDHWVGSFFVFNPNDSGSQTGARMQVDNVDQPPTQTSDDYFVLGVWDSDDLAPFFIQSVENFNTSAHDVDLDVFNTASDEDYGNRLAFAIQLETAVAPIDKTFTVDAILITEQVFNFTVDGLILDSPEKIFLVDGLVQETFTEDFTVDALIQILDQEETFIVDAFIQETQTETFTIDVITKATQTFEFTVDAFLQATQTFDFTVDAFTQETQTETFTVDAIVQATFTSDFTVDAFLQAEQVFNFTVDGLIQGEITTFFLIDGFAQETFTDEFDIDSFIEKETDKDFTVDSRLSALEEFSIDASVVRNTFFTVDSRLSALAEFAIDSLLRGVSFPVDAFIQAVDTDKTFEVNALILKTGDSLCGVNPIFFDDITTNAGWTTTGTQVKVDDGSFPNVIRMECLQSFQAGGTQQAVKSLTRPIPNHRTGIIWEFDHDHLGECNVPTANGVIELTQTSSLTSSLAGEVQPALRYRVISMGGSTLVRAEFSDGIVDIVTGTFDITTPVTIFPRVSIVNDGNDLRLEIFSDSGRTTLVSSIADEDITLLDGKELAFIQVANVGTAPPSPQKQLRGEIDNFDLKADLCPKFEIDAHLQDSNLANVEADALIQKLDIDKTFLVDAIVLKEQTETFEVDARIRNVFTEDFTISALLAVDKDFTVDAQIVRVSTFTVDAILPTTVPEDFTIDGLTFIFPSELFLIDAHVENIFTKDFTIDAKVRNTFTEDLDVDARIRDRVDKTFTIDGLIPVVNTDTFDVDALVLKEQTETFEVDAIVKATFTEDFLVDAHVENVFTKDFTVDTFARATQTFDFSVDTFSQLEKIFDFTVDVFLEQENDKDFTVDGLTTEAGQKVFLVDALIQVQDITKDFTIDTFSQIAEIRPFKIDAIVTGTQTKTFTVDAQIFLPFIANFTVDAEIEQPVSLLNFTVDAELEEIFTQGFTINGILTGDGQKVFIVDGLTLGTQTNDFTIDADLRNIKTTTFDVDAVIKLTGDALCSGSGVVFSDSIPDATGWTISGTAGQVFVDNPSFPNVIRLECFNSRLYSTAQAVKSLGTSIESKTDVAWEFKHKHLNTCSGFRANINFSLTETNTIASDINQGRITLRTLSVGSVTRVRAEIADSGGNVAVTTGIFNLVTGTTYYPRISIENGGTLLKLEYFAESSRTTSLFVNTVSTAGVNNETLNWIQVSPVGSGGASRRAVEEFDDIIINTSRCPRFDVDSILIGAVGKNFTIDAVLVETNNFTVDAVILLTGDVRCAGSNIRFQDDFTTNVGWSNNAGSRIQIDTGSFPNVLRINDLLSRTFLGIQRVTKSFSSPLKASENFVWEFTHVNLPGGDPFASEFTFDLKEDQTDVPNASADQTTIRYRTDVIPSTGPEFLRLEAFGKNGATFASSSPSTALPLTNNITYYPRITKTGNFIKLELFTDSGRTTQETGSPLQIDVSTLDMSQDLNAVWIGNYTTGGSARKIEEELDDIVVTQSRCPEFTVDAFLGIPEIDFTVDAVLVAQGKVTVDALIQALGDDGCSGGFFFDTIDDATPWTVIGGGQIVVNDTAGIIEWINLRGGTTVNERFAFREIPNFADNEGEIRIRVKVDKISDSFPFTTPTGRFMVLQNNNLHPNPSTGSTMQLGIGNNGANGGIFALVNDGTNGVSSVPQIDFLDGTTRYIEGIYDPVGQTLTLNVYTDANFTIHDVNSPVQVDASSVSMTGLTFTHMITSNVKNSGPARVITADLDDFTIGKAGCPTVQVDSIVKAFDTEKTFTVDAEITRGKIFLVGSILISTAEEQFTIDVRLSALKDFTVDAKIAFRENFTIDGSTLGTVDKDFTVDGITIIFPSGLILIDAIVQIQGTDKVFTVDSRLKAFDTEKDFTVDSQLVQDEIPKQFTIDGRIVLIQTTTFDIDGVIKLNGENGSCNFFPGTNLAVDTGLEQFIGPIQLLHEVDVEQLIGQEVTLSNQQVRSVSFLLRSSNFPNEIIPPMPIDAQVWSGVVVGNFGGETTEAVSTTVINASNTSGDLPPGDWTLVKFEFDINTTPFLTGDFVVGYRSLSSVDAPAGVGTAIPVISNSNVIDGSSVHRKGANSTLGDLDEWGFLTGESKDMVIQLEVVNGDDIILGEGNQCPLVDAILVNTPAEPLVDAVLVDRPQEDFIIDGLISPFPILFEVDSILVGTQIQFTIDAQIVPQLATFLIDVLITGDGQKPFLIDAVLQPFIEFEIDGLVQAINKNAPLFNINALLFVERTKDFTVDGLLKFFDKVEPFIIDAQVIFFPSQLPQVDGLLQKETIKFFFVDAFVQKLNQLLFPFTDVDALIQTQNVGKTFSVDGLLEGGKTTDFDVDARLSTPGAPKLFSVDALTNLQNGRWQTDALLSKTQKVLFLVDVLIVENPQKLFLIDGITIGEVNEEFIIDGLLQVEAQESFLVDARILQINTGDFDVDALILREQEADFTVDAELVRIAEYLVDSFVQALGDGELGNGNNGGTNDSNSTNPYVQQPTDDNTITLPIGTLVGQRLRLPTAPVRVTDYTFVIHRAGTAGTPTGTLTGKIYKNSIAGNSISGADLIATSDNVVNLASITTNTNGQNIQFTFTNPPEITVDDNVFIGFDIAGSNEQMFLHTESTGVPIIGGDVNVESTGVWGVDLGVDAVFTTNIDINRRQRASSLIHAFVGRFIEEIIGVDALIKAIGGVSPPPLGEKEFTVSANIRFKRIEEFKVGAILIGSQDFTVSAFVGDTLFVGLDVESVIVENNSTEGVESVIVENNSDSGVESVIGQDV